MMSNKKTSLSSTNRATEQAVPCVSSELVLPSRNSAQPLNSLSTAPNLPLNQPQFPFQALPSKLKQRHLSSARNILSAPGNLHKHGLSTATSSANVKITRYPYAAK